MQKRIPQSTRKTQRPIRIVTSNHLCLTPVSCSLTSPGQPVRCPKCVSRIPITVTLRETAPVFLDRWKSRPKILQMASTSTTSSVECPRDTSLWGSNPDRWRHTNQSDQHKVDHSDARTSQTTHFRISLVPWWFSCQATSPLAKLPAVIHDSILFNSKCKHQFQANKTLITNEQMSFEIRSPSM